MEDRRVYAVTAFGTEIVRYDRGGRWYAECDGQRQRITIPQAVAWALEPGSIVHHYIPGGANFYAALARARALEDDRASEDTRDDAHHIRSPVGSDVTLCGRPAWRVSIAIGFTDSWPDEINGCWTCLQKAREMNAWLRR